MVFDMTFSAQALLPSTLELPTTDNKRRREREPSVGVTWIATWAACPSQVEAHLWKIPFRSYPFAIDTYNAKAQQARAPVGRAWTK
jgi:hypothetical protein